MVALLAATLYAPLYHVHTDGGEAPVVHAHLPEIESAENEQVVHMEQSHSHATAKSVDLLLTIANKSVPFGAIVETSPLVLSQPEASSGFRPPAAPRAHAPPTREFTTPRAPPA